MLIYLVGLPGAGKSTYAQKLLEHDYDTIYLSSDKIREELYGDEACQDNPGRVFDLMQKRAIEAIKQNRDVIYDATNVNRKQRIGFLKSLPKNCTKICKIIWARLDTCIKRDAERDRTVGEEVIMKMAKRFQTPWYDEGWDKIEIIQDEEDVYSFGDFNLDIPHDNPHHLNTIEEHTYNVLQQVKKLKNELNDVDWNTLIQVALFHDIGKIFTKTFTNSRGEKTDLAHYYDHQNVSAYIYLGKPVYMPAEIKLKISYLINMHMEPFLNESKYYKNMDPELKKLVLLFNQCDKAGA